MPVRSCNTARLHETRRAKSAAFSGRFPACDGRLAMQTVIIVIHLMIVTVLIGTVLLQKSEGGGLGMGGGAGFMSSRGTANLLSRTTAILAARSEEHTSELHSHLNLI